MNRKALIIFVRKPELGKVKTRLAASVGDEKALSIYKELLEHTRSITTLVDADRFVFYSEEIVADDIWDGGLFQKKLQAAGDLGDKMKAAFATLFSNGYDDVLIIGSDCFELTNVIVEQGFQALNDREVVIGPANDGGYYLLGMKKLHASLFVNKEWSTANVLEQTVGDLKRENISFAKLVTLTDVDTEEDWMKTRILVP